MATDVKSQITQACDTAEDFTRLFYESLDKRRHVSLSLSLSPLARSIDLTLFFFLLQLVDRLYMDSATFVFNGIGQSGTGKIKEFYQELPVSEHRLHSLDAQPVVDNAVSGQLTFLIQTSGMVRYDNKPERPFQQTFIITAQGDKWKIFSDCYRIQDELFK